MKSTLIGKLFAVKNWQDPGRGRPSSISQAPDVRASEHQSKRCGEYGRSRGGGAGRAENVQKDLLRGRDHNKYR